MKDFTDILTRTRNQTAQLADAVAATIVNTVGSSYRRPGARLLIESSGTITGVLSGGCLEADLAERARAVRSDGRPELITYDTSSPSDIVDGLGIGCNGKVQVLLEPWPVAARALRFADTVLQENRRGVIATVFHVRGFPDVQWGARLYVDDQSESAESMPDQNLQRAVTERARALLPSGSTTVESIQVGVEVADVLFEVVGPALSVAIFGAGPGSSVLARLAKELGWRVTLVDHRDKASYRDDFARVDRQIIGDYSHIQHSLALESSLAAVVMSHSFVADLEYLKILLPSPVRYIGLLGSRTRSDELLQALSKEGLAVSSARERLYNPIGLDIGAEGPEEIALAILSEIKAVLSRRPGGFLRDRKGPIHERRSPRDPR